MHSTFASAVHPLASSTRPGRTGVRAAIAGVGSWLPDRVVTSAEVEDRIRTASPGLRGLRPGTIERRSGVVERRYLDPGDDASDLAMRATRGALSDAGLEADDVELLIFASGSQDLIEPATAHLVNRKLGARATVFDVKNACNSFLNGVQVADALIRSGQYTRAVVCTGEAPSMAARWHVTERARFVDSFVGYTLGDAGAAVVLEGRDDGTGVQHVEFRSASEHWELCTLRGGGSMHWRDPAYDYFAGDGHGLREAFRTWGTQMFDEMMARAGAAVDDYDFVAVHQVTAPFLDVLLECAGISSSRVVRIVERLGNVASASLPVQLDLGVRAGRVPPGARVLLVGLGAGISLGVVGVQT